MRCLQGLTEYLPAPLAMTLAPMLLTFLYGLPVAVFGYVSRWLWLKYDHMRFTSVIVKDECVAACRS